MEFLIYNIKSSYKQILLRTYKNKNKATLAFNNTISSKKFL